MMIGAAGALTAFGGLLYEPGNYAAQDNLVVNFDGIRNAGPLKAHGSCDAGCRRQAAQGKRRQSGRAERCGVDAGGLLQGRFLHLQRHIRHEGASDVEVARRRHGDYPALTGAMAP